MLPRRLPLVLVWILLAVPAAGQSLFNHPELDWQSFETEHFRIHFHPETERSAREAARVAEQIYGPVTRLYNYEPPRKTHLIIKDVNDNSNGMAYYFENKIEIWARPLDYDLRGSHRWIQDVITHEFVHIIQINTAMKFSSRVPGGYLQYMSYEDEDRDDVLYGYPNTIISYAIPGVSIPPWFAEGVAQYMYAGANYDYWDSHRDMLLRDRALNGNLLSFTAMSTFGKRGIGNESAYNQGFAFVRWLADEHGEKSLMRISDAMSAPFAVSMNRAMKKATGVSGTDLYQQWSAELEQEYLLRTVRIRENPVKGVIVAGEGTANLHPVWHPDGLRFAYLSNKAADYFGQTSLYVRDLQSGEEERISARAVFAPVWDAAGENIYYAARSEPNRNGSVWLDLYAYELATEKETRLTHDARAASPVFIDEKRLAFLSMYDGTANIMVYDLVQEKVDTLSHFSAGEMIYSLTLDKPANRLIFDLNVNHGRTLQALDLASNRIELVYQDWITDGGDIREPFARDGQLLFSSDATGIFNLVRLDSTGQGGYITNVTGGAFMPAMNQHGQVLYSLYSDGAYRIALLENPEIIRSAVGMDPDYWSNLPTSPQESPRNDLVAGEYVETMSSPFIMPRVMIDYGTVKPGFYFFANEIIDRFTIFGGGSINSLGDRDAFLLFDFRKFRPSLFAEFYYISRYVSQDLEWYNYKGQDDLGFVMVEIVVGGRQPVGNSLFTLSATPLSRYRMQIEEQIENLRAGIPIDYYVGNSLALRWDWSSRVPEFGGNLFPTRGTEANLEIKLERNDLADGFSISEQFATLTPDYQPNNTTRITANLKQHLLLNRKHRITAHYEGQLGWMSNQETDSFFDFFGGGLPGIRGYTFYDSTLTGPNLMIHTAHLRVPLMMEQHIPVMQFILQNAVAQFTVQYGDAFSGNWLGHKYKSSWGFELRLNGYNFYVFPFAVTAGWHRPMEDSKAPTRRYFTFLFDF